MPLKRPGLLSLSAGVEHNEITVLATQCELVVGEAGAPSQKCQHVAMMTSRTGQYIESQGACPSASLRNNLCPARTVSAPGEASPRTNRSLH